MKVAGRVAVCGFVLALAGAVLHVALSPNETPAEGAADPFLLVRRPVLRALESFPFLRFRAKGWLPWDSEVTTIEGMAALPVCRQNVRREPVYRGLFWRVGRRIDYRLTYFREHDESWRTVRLCYAVGSRRFVAAESPTPDPRCAQVSGFVPDSARGYWVEYTDDNGEAYWLNTWGQTEPFVDDSSSSPWAPCDRRRAERAG